MTGTTHAHHSHSGLRRAVTFAAIVLLGAVFMLWAWRTAEGARAELDQQRAAEMISESRALCEKWGLPAGTPRFIECLADIQTVRDRHVQRLIEDDAL
jgi:hypothetical protein